MRRILFCFAAVLTIIFLAGHRLSDDRSSPPPGVTPSQSCGTKSGTEGISFQVLTR